MSEAPTVSNPVILDGEEQLTAKNDALAALPSPVPDPPKVTELEAYYHGLYHLVTHWAAFVAMMGVLLTIGLLMCLTPIARDVTFRNRRILALFIIILCSSMAGLYFIDRMKLYSNEINRKLPPAYKERLRKVFHDPSIPIIWRGRLATAFLTIFDLVLLYLSW